LDAGPVGIWGAEPVSKHGDDRLCTSWRADSELLWAQVAATPLCSDHGLAGQPVKQLTDGDGSQLSVGLPQGDQARRTEELSERCLAMGNLVDEHEEKLNKRLQAHGNLD
jgi:hypothetical protein